MPRPRLLPSLLLVALVALGCTAAREPSVLALDRVARSASAVVPPSLAEEDGRLPDGATAYDEHPGVARLDGRLLAQLRQATADASDEGVDVVVTSGWRSRGYQSRLFDEAVAEHGSEAAAAAWVARPGTSVHEAGQAVDVGPWAAIDWLAQHGAAYGLCQVYANEPWHFELVPTAVTHGCPPGYDDPTDDPRLQ